jgi:hypothetical protein
MPWRECSVMEGLLGGGPKRGSLIDESTADLPASFAYALRRSFPQCLITRLVWAGKSALAATTELMGRLRSHRMFTTIKPSVCAHAPFSTGGHYSCIGGGNVCVKR